MFNPWVILGFLLAFGGAFLSGDLYRGHQDKIAYDGAIAKQERDAATLLAAKTAEIAAKDAANSDLARKLDEQHANETRAIADAADTAERGYTDSLRKLAGRRTSCGNTGTAEAAHLSVPADTAAGSQRELLDRVAEHLRRVGERANTLASTVNECVAWANKVGR